MLGMSIESLLNSFNLSSKQPWGIPEVCYQDDPDEMKHLHSNVNKWYNEKIEWATHILILWFPGSLDEDTEIINEGPIQIPFAQIWRSIIRMTRRNNIVITVYFDSFKKKNKIPQCVKENSKLVCFPSQFDELYEELNGVKCKNNESFDKMRKIQARFPGFSNELNRATKYYNPNSYRESVNSESGSSDKSFQMGNSSISEKSADSQVDPNCPIHGIHAMQTKDNGSGHGHSNGYEITEDSVNGSPTQRQQLNSVEHNLEEANGSDKDMSPSTPSGSVLNLQMMAINSLQPFETADTWEKGPSENDPLLPQENYHVQHADGQHVDDAFLQHEYVALVPHNIAQMQRGNSQYAYSERQALLPHQREYLQNASNHHNLRDSHDSHPRFLGVHPNHISNHLTFEMNNLENVRPTQHFQNTVRDNHSHFLNQMPLHGFCDVNQLTLTTVSSLHSHNDLSHNLPHNMSSVPTRRVPEFNDDAMECSNGYNQVQAINNTSEHITEPNTSGYNTLTTPLSRHDTEFTENQREFLNDRDVSNPELFRERTFGCNILPTSLPSRDPGFTDDQGESMIAFPSQVFDQRRDINMMQDQDDVQNASECIELTTRHSQSETNSSEDTDECSNGACGSDLKDISDEEWNKLDIMGRIAHLNFSGNC